MWKKLGLVFCPNGEIPWMNSHASVPIAEHVREDVFRVYFSCRDKSNRSNVAWIEIDLIEPTKILAMSSSPLISPGPPGAFDDSGTMLSWLISDNGTKYFYYIGWNLGVTVPFRNSIGLAVEQSGILKKLGAGPILDRDQVDPFFVASSCVLKENGRWRMWYLSCTGWETTDAGLRHGYLIKYAESEDGRTWKKSGLVSIGFKNADEYAISRPSVLHDGNSYKMWYSHRGNKYRIGYAESSDGISWTRRDDMSGIDVSTTGWDSEMIEYPFVFDHAGKRYMLYNGNDYGRTGFGIAEAI